MLCVGGHRGDWPDKLRFRRAKDEVGEGGRAADTDFFFVFTIMKKRCHGAE